MLRFLLFLVANGLLLSTASAQSEVFWAQTGVGTNEFIQQKILSGNGAGVGKSEVSFSQQGNGNRIVHRNQGVNQTTFNQVGDGNRVELNLTGNGNRYGINQLGNRNVLSLPDVQTSNVELQLIQRGDGNELVRAGTLSTGVSMRIEQTGGMRITIANGAN